MDTSRRKNSCFESAVEAFSQGILSAPPSTSRCWEVKSFEEVSLHSQVAKSDFVFPFLPNPISLLLSPPTAAEASKDVSAYLYGEGQTWWLKVCVSLVEAYIPTTSRSTSRRSNPLTSNAPSPAVYLHTKLTILYAFLFLFQPQVEAISFRRTVQRE